MATNRMHRMGASTRWGQLWLVMAMVTALLVVAPPAAQAALPDVGFASATSSPGEAAGTVNITVELSAVGVLTEPLIFDVVDAATGTANPADYSFTSPAPQLQFDIGDGDNATRVVPITINQDSIDEDNQTVVLELQPVSGGDIDPAANTHTLTIVDDDAAPSISINTPAAVTEGSAVNFTVSLSGNPTEKTIGASYATSNGTAIAGSDYTTKSGSVTFTPGDVSEQVSIATINDTTDELDGKTFTVTLSSPSNASPGTMVGTGTINDNDVGPTVSINNAPAVTEGNPAIFTVTLAGNATEKTVGVSYATTNGTAIAGTDYTTKSGTVTFTPGDTSEQISIVTLNDGTSEPNGDTFTVTLSSPSNASPGTMVGTGTINDNDGTPTVSINSPGVVTEGTSVGFTVTLSNPSATTVTVNYATANGSAIAGSDYTTKSGTVTFDPGDTSEPISIVTLNDSVNEPDGETFTVTLSSPSEASLGTSVGIGTIDDDDSIPAVSINTPGAVTEGTAVGFTVTLSHASASTVTVAYTTANGTAVAGSDYTAKSGTVTFNPGDVSEPISIATLNDITDELDGETFTVTLSSPSGATLGASVGTGTINDNDPTPVVSIVATNSLVEDAGSMTFAVTLDRPSSREVTVAYATSNGSALAGSDYTDTSGTLTFAPGQITPSTPLTVALTPDALNEADETFTVTLSGPLFATLGVSSSIATIVNDDALPTLSVNSLAQEEGTSFSFTVSLSAPSGRTVTVSRTTADVTAAEPGDYTALAPLVLTFAPGETSKIVVVETEDDALDEANETFRVVLSGQTNAQMPDPDGEGTILDNDGAPGLTVVDAAPVAEGIGTVQLEFTVSLLPASGQEVRVDFATANGTAVAPGDYTGRALQTLTFAPGETSKPVLVTVVNDTIDEISETVLLNLTNPVNSTIADAQATGTILDNDNVAPSTTIAVTNAGGAPTVAFDTFETVRLSGTFTDPGLADPHTVTIDWGDGTTPTQIIVAPVTARAFASTHQYASPGLYTISTSVADEVGNGSKTAFVVINEGSSGQSTGLVDTSQGRWYLYNATGDLMQQFFYGNPGDYPFMGDWDGDGIETPGLYRQSDGYVYLRNSNTQGVANIKFFFGNPGDVPIAGDFNGDGKDTVSIYRPSNQTFYIINKLGSNDGGLGAADFSYVFGNPGDKPFVGDFDGDSVETVGLHRESTGLVYYRNTHNAGNAHNQFLFGDPGDRLVAGDWNGNGQFSPALFRPSNQTMFFRYTNTQGNADNQWSGGQSSWVPVSGATGF